MQEEDLIGGRRRDGENRALLIGLGAFAAAHVAAWFYFRQQQPEVDERTRDRLRPRTGA